MEYIKKYIQEHKDRFVEELIDLLRIPSISADPAYSHRNGTGTTALRTTPHR